MIFRFFFAYFFCSSIFLFNIYFFFFLSAMPRRGRAPRNSDNFFYKLLERLHEMDDVESPAFFEQISNYFNYLTPGEQLNENDNVILYGMLYNQLKFYIENLYNELKNSPNLTRFVILLLFCGCCLFFVYVAMLGKNMLCFMFVFMFMSLFLFSFLIYFFFFFFPTKKRGVVFVD